MKTWGQRNCPAMLGAPGGSMPGTGAGIVVLGQYFSLTMVFLSSVFLRKLFATGVNNQNDVIWLQNRVVPS